MAKVKTKLIVTVEYDTDETTATEVCGAVHESLQHTNDCDIIREIHGFRVNIMRCNLLEGKDNASK